MIFASRSSDSRASKRMPFTVPAVPTGINTGVSITPWRVVNTPARASPCWASMSKRNAGIVTLISLRLCAFAGELLVFFNDPQRRRKEIKLLPQTVHDVPLVREMQSRFASRSKHDKRRRPHTDLRQILHLQPRHPTLSRRRRGPATRLRNRALEEIVELSRRNSPVARLICF